jgi:hypothetical protein
LGITRVGQKENAAVPASLQAGPQVGLLLNNTSKFPKIAGRYPPDGIFPVPVRRKLKKTLKCYDKKAKSSLVWLIKSDIPSFSFHVFRKLMNKRGYFICKGPYAIGWVNFAKQGRVNLAQRYRSCCP